MTSTSRTFAADVGQRLFYAGLHTLQAANEHVRLGRSEQAGHHCRFDAHAILHVFFFGAGNARKDQVLFEK